MSAPEPPSRVVVCTRCGDEVEVFGALSLIRHPFVCTQCLDPRHKDAEPYADIPGAGQRGC